MKWGRKNEKKYGVPITRQRVTIRMSVSHIEIIWQWELQIPCLPEVSRVRYSEETTLQRFSLQCMNM